MNKSKWKIVFLVIFAVVLCLGAYKIADATSYHLVKAKAEHYLCKKYDAKRSDFELIDYRRSHFYLDTDELFSISLKWIDFAFEYKYNNRYFFINRYNGEFYDDYQLDDIENWCVEWLQQNVDERIIGMMNSTSNIITFYENTGYDSVYVIKKEDISQYIALSNSNENDVFNMVFCQCEEDIRGEEIRKSEEEVLKKIHEEVGETKNLSVHIVRGQILHQVKEQGIDDKLWERLNLLKSKTNSQFNKE